MENKVKTTINGIDVSQCTPKQAMSLLFAALHGPEIKNWSADAIFELRVGMLEIAVELCQLLSTEETAKKARSFQMICQKKIKFLKSDENRFRNAPQPEQLQRLYDEGLAFEDIGIILR